MSFDGHRRLTIFRSRNPNTTPTHVPKYNKPNERFKMISTDIIKDHK